MTPDRWNRIETLFERAAELDPKERAAFLDEACRAPDGTPDPALREEVTALLEADAGAEGYLQRLGEDVLGPALELALAGRDPLAGEQIGPYRLTRRIGQGGMGTVYLAERADGAFDQTVALKLVRPGLAPEIGARFRAERRILARLEHPHIAHLLDGGVADDGRPWLAMEYVDGEPITDYCDRKRLSVNERLVLFETVCEAVAFAHRNLVVHRDLKPSNILVTDDGAVKLLDFGIAKLLEDDDSFTVAETRTGMQMMTPEYAAPEQVRAESVTVATDVYALGVLLYELLTGRRPYHLAGRVRHEVERAILEEEPTRPSTAVAAPVGSASGEAPTTTPDTLSQARRADTATLRRRLAGDLDQIVLTALRKEPERRYGSADAFADDIRRHLDGLPVKAQPDTVGYRTRKFVRRHRLGLGAAALVFLALAAGLGAALWQAERAESEARRAQAEAAKANEVSAFLTDLFESNDPAQALGDSILVRTVLDRGARRINDELVDQPEVRAALLSVLGEVYRRLGRLDRADSLVRQSLVLRRTLYPEDHRDVAASLFRVGSVLRDQGQLDSAEVYLREAVAMIPSTYGSLHEEALSIQNELALVLHSQSRFEEAAPLYREVLETGRELHGPRHPNVGTYATNLASLFTETERLGEAIPLLREAYGIFEEAHGANHPLTVLTLNNLAVTEKRSGDLVAAEASYRTALERLADLYGPEHPYVAATKNNLGSLLRDRGAFSEAEHFYGEAYTVFSQSLGPDHPSTLTVRFNRAEAQRRLGDLSRAETEHEAVLTTRHRVLGPNHTDTASSLYALGHLRLARGDGAGAEGLLREALRIREDRLQPGSSELALARVALGKSLLAQKRPAEAEPLLRLARSAVEAEATVAEIDSLLTVAAAAR